MVHRRKCLSVNFTQVDRRIVLRECVKYTAVKNHVLVPIDAPQRYKHAFCREFTNKLLFGARKIKTIIDERLVDPFESTLQAKCHFGCLLNNKIGIRTFWSAIEFAIRCNPTKMTEDNDCPICFDRLLTPTVLVPCGHTICGVCVLRLDDTCWLCRQHVDGTTVSDTLCQQMLVGASDAELARHATAMVEKIEVGASASLVPTTPVDSAELRAHVAFTALARRFDTTSLPRSVRCAEFELTNNARAHFSLDVSRVALEHNVSAVNRVMTNYTPQCRVAVLFRMSCQEGQNNNPQFEFLPQTIVTNRFIVTDVTVVQARISSNRQHINCTVQMNAICTRNQRTRQLIRLDEVDKRGLEHANVHYTMHAAARARPWMTAKRLHFIFLSDTNLQRVSCLLWNSAVQKLLEYYAQYNGQHLHETSLYMSRDFFYLMYSWISTTAPGIVSAIDQVSSSIVLDNEAMDAAECFVLIQGIPCE